MRRGLDCAVNHCRIRECGVLARNAWFDLVDVESECTVFMLGVLNGDVVVIFDIEDSMGSFIFFGELGIFEVVIFEPY